MKHTAAAFYLLFMFTIAAFVHPSSVSAQTGCVQIQNVQVRGTVEMGKQFECLVTADTPSSPNVACGIRIGDLNQWPNNYCPSDTAFGGWSGNTATFRCTIPQRSDITANTQAQLVAYDFRSSCGPQTGKTQLITINTGGQQGGTPAPTQGTGPSPTPGGNTTPQPTTPVQNTPVPEDLNKCIGYDVYGLVERVRRLAGDELADAMLARYREICAGKTQGTQPGTTPGAGTPAAGTPTPPQNGAPVGDLSGLLDISEPPDSSIIGQVSQCLQNKSMYEEVAREVGVPWQIFAGVHFREGGCDPTHSMVSGRIIGANEPDLHGACSSQDIGRGKPIPLPGGGCGFSNWIDSGIYGARLLIKKIGKVPSNVQELTLALSNYNGGGNRNCGKTPYPNCPPAFPREDDMYVWNKFDARHTPMYLIYCADYTPCNPPRIYSGLGVFAAVKAVAYSDNR